MPTLIRFLPAPVVFAATPRKPAPRFAWVVTAAALVAALGATPPAAAATPGEAILGAQFEGPDLGAKQPVFTPGLGATEIDSTEYLGFEKVTVSEAPLVLSAEAVTGHLQFAFATVGADYQFQVIGASPDTLVNLKIAIAMQDTSAFTLPQDPVFYESASGSSSIYIETDKTYYNYSQYSATDYGPQSFSADIPFTMTAGTIGSIDLGATAVGHYGGVASAWIDPVITIVDPTPGESLVISDGIGNTSPGSNGFGAAPEPAAWGLMLVGLWGVGVGLRRRRGLAIS